MNSEKKEEKNNWNRENGTVLIYEWNRIFSQESKNIQEKNEESRNRKNVLFLCENEWEMDELIEMRWLSGEKVSDDAN